MDGYGAMVRHSRTRAARRHRAVFLVENGSRSQKSWLVELVPKGFYLSLQLRWL